MAREMMKYSSSVPLNVDWNRSHPEFRQTHFDLLLEALERPSQISSLRLYGISAHQTTSLLARMTEPAPYLRSIDLVPRGVDQSVLPVNFLGGDAPRLISIDIIGCSIPWGSSALRNLATIHVWNMTTPIDTPLKDIAFTLKAATQLVSVNILDYCPTRIDATLPQDLTIVLPYLERLYLSSRAIVVVTLLQRMTFPASTIVHLETNELENTLDSLCGSISGLFSDRSTNPTPIRRVKGLELSHTDGEGIMLRVWNPQHRTAGDVCDNLRSPHFTLQLKDPAHTGIEVDILPILQRLLESLGTIQYLEELRIGVPSFRQSTMIQRFGSCPLLHSITTYGISIEVVLGSLSQNLSGTTQPIPYPTLSTVGFYDVDFDVVPMSRFLVEMLRRRSELGTPVTKIVLECCKNLYRNSVVMLRGEVGSNIEVDWDEVEMDSIDSDSD
ncbi:hypothetical protein PM082_003664 [Marasmius tenuissimus]|nr:hypothetical protein PM082_003664 [Marasmius tenuissimus]